MSESERERERERETDSLREREGERWGSLLFSSLNLVHHALFSLPYLYMYIYYRNVLGDSSAPLPSSFLWSWW